MKQITSAGHDLPSKAPFFNNTLVSLPPAYRALVFGGSGGIGAALVAALAGDPRCSAVYSATRRAIGRRPNVERLAFSLEDEASIATCMTRATAAGPLNLIIVATGLLQDDKMTPEKSWRAIDATALERAFRTNTIGPALIAKHALDRLCSKNKAVFAALSARVGSIEDNRLGGWHAYRSSKAALNMVMKTCAIELNRRNPTAVCVSMHPGTVDTALSEPFQSGAGARKLFTPDFSAASLLSVIDGLTPEDSGKLIAWDGSQIPY